MIEIFQLVHLTNLSNLILESERVKSDFPKYSGMTINQNRNHYIFAPTGECNDVFEIFCETIKMVSN